MCALPVLLLLLLLLSFLPVDADPTQPKCGPQDWFAMNVYALAMKPLVERTSFVMSALPVSSSSLPPTLPCLVRGETCAALGVQHGVDVLAVWARILLGWRWRWLTSRDYCVFDDCPALSTVHATPAEDERTRCRLATRTMRCAWEYWHWGAAYVALAVALVVGALAALVTMACCGK